MIIECEHELNRGWIYDEEEIIGETNFIVPTNWLKETFDNLNNDNQFICYYDNLNDFLRTYEPETDGELIYQNAIADGVLKEDLGVVIY